MNNIFKRPALKKHTMQVEWSVLLDKYTIEEITDSDGEVNREHKVMDFISHKIELIMDSVEDSYVIGKSNLDYDFFLTDGEFTILADISNEFNHTLIHRVDLLGKILAKVLNTKVYAYSIAHYEGYEQEINVIYIGKVV